MRSDETRAEEAMDIFLLLLACPFLIAHHYLCKLRLYRWLCGGHWERWDCGGPGNPAGGWLWFRGKREECYRMTGEKPLGLRGSPYCEEEGKRAYEQWIYCKCGRDLTRAPGVHGAYEGDPETSAVFGYSCPCGRWPRFMWGFGWHYLGDARELSLP